MDPLILAPYAHLESSPTKTRRHADPSLKLTLPALQDNSPSKGKQRSSRNPCNFNVGFVPAEGANDYLINSKPFFPLTSHINPLPNFLGLLSDRETVANPPKKTKVVSFQDESPLEASKRKQIDQKNPLPSLAKANEASPSYRGFNTTRNNIRNIEQQNSPKATSMKHTRSSPENFTDALKNAKPEPITNKVELEELSPSVKEGKLIHKIKMRKLAFLNNKNMTNDQNTHNSNLNSNFLQYREGNFVSRSLHGRETSEEPKPLSLERVRSDERVHFDAASNKQRTQRENKQVPYSGSQIEGDPVARAIIAHLRPQGEAAKEYLLPHIPQSMNKMTGSSDLKLTKQTSLAQFFDYGENTPQVETPQNFYGHLKQDPSNEGSVGRRYRLPLRQKFFGTLI